MSTQHPVIKVQCKCGEVHQFDAAYEGRTARCPKLNHRFIVASARAGAPPEVPGEETSAPAGSGLRRQTAPSTPLERAGSSPRWFILVVVGVIIAGACVIGLIIHKDRQAKRAAEDAVWAQVERASVDDRLAKAEGYLEAYPEGHHVQKAENVIQEVEAWQRISEVIGTPEAVGTLTDFLLSYPGSPHTASAQDQLQDEKAWDHILAMDSDEPVDRLQGLRDYLANFPQGTYRSTAQTRIEDCWKEIRTTSDPVRLAELCHGQIRDLPPGPDRDRAQTVLAEAHARLKDQRLREALAAKAEAEAKAAEARQGTISFQDAVKDAAASAGKTHTLTDVYVYSLRLLLSPADVAGRSASERYILWLEKDGKKLAVWGHGTDPLANDTFRRLLWAAKQRTRNDRYLSTVRIWSTSLGDDVEGMSLWAPAGVLNDPPPTRWKPGQPVWHLMSLTYPPKEPKEGTVKFEHEFPHRAKVELMRLSANGAHLFTVAKSTGYFWDVSEQVVLTTVPHYPQKPSTGDCLAPALLSPDGYYLVKWAGKEVALIDLLSEQAITTFSHGDGVTDFALSPDGQFLASVTLKDGVLRTWDVHSGKVVRTFRDNIQARNLAWTPDGKSIFASGAVNGDPLGTLWDIGTGEVRCRLDGVERVGSPSCVFSPDGRLLVTETLGKEQFWDAASGEPLRWLEDQIPEVQYYAFSPDGRFLAIATGHLVEPGGSQGGGRGRSRKRQPHLYECLLWDLESGSLAHRLEIPGHICVVAFMPNRERLLIVTGQASLWDPQTGQQVLTFPTPDGVREAMLSPDGESVFLRTEFSVYRVEIPAEDADST